MNRTLAANITECLIKPSQFKKQSRFKHLKKIRAHQLANLIPFIKENKNTGRRNELNFSNTNFFENLKL